MTVRITGKTRPRPVALSKLVGWRFFGRREAGPTEPAGAEWVSVETAGEPASDTTDVGPAFLQVATDNACDGTNCRVWEGDDTACVFSVHGRGKPTFTPNLPPASGREAATRDPAPASDDQRDTYHHAGRGRIGRAGLAGESLAGAAAPRQIDPVPRIATIDTRDCPTPGRRPANPTLDCRWFETTFDLSERLWREALTEVPDRIDREVLQ